MKNRLPELTQLLRASGLEFVITRVDGGKIAHINVYVGGD